MSFSIKKIKLNHLLKFFIFSTFTLFLLFMAKKYFDQAVTFSFVDEYDNFIAAYFMMNGKKLFSEIFHNRQLGMVYLSYLIQFITHPQTLYQLVVIHRLFIIVFSFLFSLFLVWRFGLIAVGFVLLYEPIKYYFHGNLFLAESLIIYPLLYLFLLVILIKQEKIMIIESILVGIFIWFVFFMREPYVPLVFFLFISYCLKFKKSKYLIISLIVFSILTFFTLLTVNFKDYFYQLFEVNNLRVFNNKEDGLTLIGFIKSFFYPVQILFGGYWNHFRIIITTYSILLLFLIVLVKVFFKKNWQILFIFISLGLAALRTIEPGKIFYGTYRMTQWYGLIIVSILILTKFFYDNKKNKIVLTSILVLVLVFFYSIFSKEGFVWKKFDKQQMFNVNYNRYFVNGEVIKLLSDKDDSLFVDGYESLIFWQAGIPSSYKYGLYYPVMKGISRFDQEKNKMLKTKMPTFYFIDCIYRNINPIPKEISANFKQFIYTVINEETCLYINKNKIKKLSEEKIKSIEKYNYRLEEN
jgi:hypothetical protein